MLCFQLIKFNKSGSSLPVQVEYFDALENRARCWKCNHEHKRSGMKLETFCNKVNRKFLFQFTPRLELDDYIKQNFFIGKLPIKLIYLLDSSFTSSGYILVVISNYEILKIDLRKPYSTPFATFLGQYLLIKQSRLFIYQIT